MLRRFAPFMVLALIVLASVGVFIIRAITANRDPCAEVFAALNEPLHLAGKNKNLCDFHVQASDGLQAYIRHIEDARDRCGLTPSSEFLDSLKANYAEAVQTRIEACDAAAADQHSGVSTRLVVSAEFDTNSSDREPCKALLASVLHDAPPDQVWKAFESHHTKKNYCAFLVEYFNSEQAIIDRFENAKAECTVPDWLKSKHAKTLERRTKVCDAAAVDPNGLVSSYTR
jgi:hypothetical protein